VYVTLPGFPHPSKAFSRHHNQSVRQVVKAGSLQGQGDAFRLGPGQGDRREDVFDLLWRQVVPFDESESDRLHRLPGTGTPQGAGELGLHGVAGADNIVRKHVGRSPLGSKVGGDDIGGDADIVALFDGGAAARFLGRDPHDPFGKGVDTVIAKLGQPAGDGDLDLRLKLAAVDTPILEGA
jgi:hypothetical protein